MSARHVKDTAGSTSKRTLLTTGRIAYCNVCEKRQPILNVRSWPRWPIVLRSGECGVCHNTVTV